MGVLHDLRCERGHRLPDEQVTPGQLPPCSTCGAPTSIDYGGWGTVHGDFGGQPFYSDAAGRWFTSQGDQDRHMRKLGYHPAGDKVHGGRNETAPTHAGFSYPGQTLRRSTGESGLTTPKGTR